MPSVAAMSTARSPSARSRLTSLARLPAVAGRPRLRCGVRSEVPGTAARALCCDTCPATGRPLINASAPMMARLSEVAVSSVRPPGRRSTRNDAPRLDVNGAYVDAHDGCIVAHAGTYYLYGESYQNATGGTFPGDWGNSPQLAVYTSPDLTAWTYRGSPLSNDDADATKWIPNVLWVESQQRFVMWGGSGDWFVATSTDGIAFTLATAHTTSRLGGGTDGTGFFVDDDGQG